MHNAMQPSTHERPQSIVQLPLNAVDRLAVPDPKLTARMLRSSH